MFGLDTVLYKFRMFSFEKICVGLFIAGAFTVVPAMAIHINEPGVFIFVDYEALMDKNIVFLNENRPYYDSVIEKFNGKVPRSFRDDLFRTYVEKLNQHEHYRNLATEQAKRIPHPIFNHGSNIALSSFCLLSAGLLGVVLSGLKS